MPLIRCNSTYLVNPCQAAYILDLLSMTSVLLKLRGLMRIRGCCDFTYWIIKIREDKSYSNYAIVFQATFDKNHKGHCNPQPSSCHQNCAAVMGGILP